ncbi:MAG: hypothetical protein WA771_15770 [Chthoniobacterales bacterium]
MPTYIYESIAAAGEKPNHYEIEQSETAEAITNHPDSGMPIRRVIVDGSPLTKQESCCDDEDDSCCGESSSCC